MGMALRNTIDREPLKDGPRVLPEHTPELNPRLNPHFHKIIGSRSAAPLSYMIASHPADVAGPVKEVVVVEGEHLGYRKAVMIKLRPVEYA